MTQPDENKTPDLHQHRRYSKPRICNRFIQVTPHSNKGITPEHIKGCVCRYFNIHPDKLSAPGKKSEMFRARYFVWHFIFLYCPMSLEKAGAIFNRDHVSVQNGVSKLRWEAEHMKRTGDMMRDLERKIIREWDQMP